MALSDRVVVMQAGKILQQGSPEEIYQRPVTRQVAAFFGSPNFLDAKVTGCAALGEGRYRLAVEGTDWHGSCLAGESYRGGDAVMMMVRPENMAIVPPGTVAGEGRTVWPGTVIDSIFRGARRSIAISAAGRVFHVEAPSLRPATPGSEVALVAEADHSWAIRP